MKKVLIANWKMFLSPKESQEWMKKFLPFFSKKNEFLNLIICPSFVDLWQMKKQIGSHSSLFLGAQDLFWEQQGAYTGKVSGCMLSQIGCQYVLIGHSEQRALEDSDQKIQKKINIAYQQSLRPILCVGENFSAYKRKQTMEVLYQQIDQDLSFVKKEKELIIAYEPIWAISTQKKSEPQPHEMEEVHKKIRIYMQRKYEKKFSSYQIVYGGSIGEKNINDFLTLTTFDGFLVGRASTELASWKKIIQKTQEVSLIR
jgi:triosephosphate isomerase